MNNKIVSDVVISGLQESIRAAKYPMSVDINSLDSSITKGIQNLAQSRSGEGHDQFLTGINVQFDLCCTLKMWIEAERYTFLNFVSSQSTMHRITKFSFDKQCNEYVRQEIINIMNELVEDYTVAVEKHGADSQVAKDAYLTVLYNNPSGFKLTARMTTNYRALKTIYQQRKNHRLPEWREFCRWVESLPMSYLITGKGEVNVV
jgi:hypothetical protein